MSVDDLIDEGLDYRIAHPSITERGMRNYLEGLAGNSERSSLEESRLGCLSLLFISPYFFRNDAMWNHVHSKKVDKALKKLFPKKKRPE